MNRTLLSLLAVTVLMPAFAGCGPSREEQRQDAVEDAAEEMERRAEDGDAAGAMEAFGNAMEQMNSGEGRAEPVDFRVLKERMPESIEGLARTSHTGERGGAMGMAVSQAEAVYEGDDGERLTIKIVDLGNVPQVAMMGYGWALADIDRESDDEYERTMRFQGHRGYEKYNTTSRSGEMNLLVAGRFMVEADGRNVDMDVIRAAVEAVDLGELEDMRDEGRES